MGLIERLKNIGYTHREAEEIYEKFNAKDNILELEMYIEDLESKNINKNMPKICI